MESVLIKNRGITPGRTLEELFSAHHGCTLNQFRPRIFWRTLHSHALIIAPPLLLGHYFALDFQLISSCGRARSMDALREEIQTYRDDPQNAEWLRRCAKVRISTRKLQKVARAYLKG
jgi:hypothetical protein